MTQHYPRRLYLGGQVIDAEATNSVVVADAAAEADARARGYRGAWEPDNGANGCSPAAPVSLPEPQVEVATDCATTDDLETLRKRVIDRGLKPHHRAGVAKLREMLGEAA
jgi:hypothetical protein